jgi:hypothetical protein
MRWVTSSADIHDRRSNPVQDHRPAFAILGHVPGQHHIPNAILE